MSWSTLPRILFWTVPHAGGAVGDEKTMEIVHERVAGLDMHKNTVVPCVRVASGKEATRECRKFETTTDGLLALRAWLSECRCASTWRWKRPVFTGRRCEGSSAMGTSS
jgi:hypothetical protein